MTVVGVTAVGVPVISPVDGLIDRPVGIVPAVIVQGGAPPDKLELLQLLHRSW